jgi:hypothetical protein
MLIKYIPRDGIKAENHGSDSGAETVWDHSTASEASSSDSGAIFGRAYGR